MMNKKIHAALLCLSMVLVSGCKEQARFYSNTFRSDVFTQLYADSQYDFLWVIDNSPSMASRRQYIRDNISSFLTLLMRRKAMNAQMAVVTTAQMDQAGALISGAGGIQVVKTTDSDPIGEFQSIIDGIADSPKSFWEQGLESAYQAITKNKSVFSRPGVPLILIVVTDADDYSCSTNCNNNEMEHNPNARNFTLDRYINLFRSTKAAENTVTLMFPITGMDNLRCPVENAGVRYILVQKALGNGGISGSVCDADIGQSYLNIAKTIADRGSVFKLSTPANGRGINLYVDQQLVPNDPDNYIFDPVENAIIFTNEVPKTGSTIQVTYLQ